MAYRYFLSRALIVDGWAPVDRNGTGRRVGEVMPRPPRAIRSYSDTGLSWEIGLPSRRIDAPCRLSPA